MSFGGWIKDLFENNGVVLPDAPPSEQEPGPALPMPPVDPTPDHVKYEHLDPTHIVPRQPLQVALNYFDAHKDAFKNQRYLTVVDFTPHSGKKRFFVIDMESGEVEAHCVAHGSGSDPDNDGYCSLFSNNAGSHQSSLGIYRIAEKHFSDHYKFANEVDGLSKTNSIARERAILVHSSLYVSDSADKQGRSFGCFALQESLAKGIISKITGGSILIAWHNNFPFA